MTNGKLDTKKLRDLYASNSAARTILDEFARRERNRTVTKVENLLFVRDGDRALSRGDVIQVLQGLADIGCGTFVVGRRGGSSRLEWSVSLPAVGKAAAGEDVEPQKITAEEREEEEEHGIEEGIVESYSFPLRPGHKMTLDLPLDLTDAEAARLADFIKSLPFRKG